MRQFLQHHGEQILGVLNGFDRLRLRGSLRMFGAERGVVGWLHQAGIALKDFLRWAEGLTGQLRRRTEEDAKAAGRPVEYLAGKVDKEKHVAKIRAKHGVAKNGLVAVLSTLEMGTSYELHRYRDTDRCVLYRKPRKCLYYYYYWDDGRFGLTQVRLQSYFPFHVHVVLNGSSAEAGLAWPTEPTVEARASAAYGILQGCAGGLLLDERTDRVGHGRIVP